MTDRAHMPAEPQDPGLLCYEDLLDAASDRYDLARVRREHRQLAVLHQRHHRQPQGRAVQPPLDGAAHLRRRAARRAELLGARRDPARGADVPRQRLGPALRGLHGGAKLVFPGAGLDGKSLYELFESEGVTLSAGVPTVWQGLLAHVQANGLKFSTMKRTVIGGSACPPAMIRTFGDNYGVHVLHAWGMTEMSPLGTVCTFKAQAPEQTRKSATR
jgi:3-(methylthio)propionyl---CoA ligase